MESIQSSYENEDHIVNKGDGRNSVSVWQANCVCVLTTIFMLGLNAVLTKFGKPKFVREDVSFWKWRNILVSWIHGVIAGVWNFLCLWWYPGVFEDPVFFINNFTYLMIPFSSGYFIYDCLDHMFCKRLTKDWETTLHHVLVLIGMAYNWNTKICIGYSIFAFMAEINSIFLHLRKLFQFSQVRFDSLLYRVVSILNLVTFITCRLIPQGHTLNGFYKDGYRVPSTYFKVLAILYPPGFIINVVLFWRIFKSDVLRSMKKDKTTSLSKSCEKKTT